MQLKRKKLSKVVERILNKWQLCCVTLETLCEMFKRRRRQEREKNREQSILERSCEQALKLIDNPRVRNGARQCIRRVYNSVQQFRNGMLYIHCQMKTSHVCHHKIMLIIQT